MDQPETEAPTTESAEATATKNSPVEPLTGWSAMYDFIVQSYCWLMIFFILYVLSIGPFYNDWREAVDLGKRPLLQAVYLPLAGLCSEYETMNTVVEWYVELWQS